MVGGEAITCVAFIRNINVTFAYKFADKNSGEPEGSLASAQRERERRNV